MNRSFFRGIRDIFVRDPAGLFDPDNPVERLLSTAFKPLYNDAKDRMELSLCLKEYISESGEKIVTDEHEFAKTLEGVVAKGEDLREYDAVAILAEKAILSSGLLIPDEPDNENYQGHIVAYIPGYLNDRQASKYAVDLREKCEGFVIIRNKFE